MTVISIVKQALEATFQDCTHKSTLAMNKTTFAVFSKFKSFKSYTKKLYMLL